MSRIPRIVFDEPGRKVRLDDMSAEPPKGMTRDKAEKRFIALGKELFDLQDAMFGAKVNSVLVVLQAPSSTWSAASIRAA
jgi:hypothetical protein